VKTTRRDFLKKAGLRSAALSTGPFVVRGLGQHHRPNILVIITDDQRADTLTEDYMPFTWSNLVQQGVLFERGFVTTPLCAPCRSSVLTGRLGRHTGVLTNNVLLQETTFVERIHDRGYYTGQVGKFLNPWNGAPWPGYDYWVAHPGGASPYFNPRLNVNGEFAVYEGYITHLLRDFALKFLEQTPEDQPFFLYFAPNAPHAQFHDAPGYEDYYQDLPPHRPPSFNEEDVSDKPAWLQALTLMNRNQIAQVDTRRRQQLQMIRPVDDAIQDIFSLLIDQGRLDNTFVFFMGDNGFFWGEHRVRMGKNRVYEEAQRVPFAVRFPPLAPVKEPRVEHRLVANIDIAPTIYQVAGMPIPAHVDGRSLIPLLRGSSRWRNALLFEGRSNPAFQAIRTERFVYVENTNQRSELYTLGRDPYQLENAADDPDYAELVKELSARLAEF